MLFCVGCSAQSSAPNDETTTRLKKLIRANFNVRPSVDITLGERKPSEFTGYDILPVTLSEKQNSHTYEFLVSKDGKKLMRMNPVEDVEQKISVADRPIRGNKDAKVKIIVFDDFQCPYCRSNHEELFGDVMKDYGDKVEVIYKDYPLAEIHPWAMHAAIDAECLAAQNKDAYWDFADYVHPHAREISGQNRPLAEQFDELDKITTQIGEKRKFNMETLQACVEKQDDSAVLPSIKEGEALGINATPTIFINGLKADGVLPGEEWRAIIDRDLRDAGLNPPVHSPQPAAQPAASEQPTGPGKTSEQPPPAKPAAQPPQRP